MSRFKGSYNDPTTISYFCKGCGQSVASPISFHCRWSVIGTNGRGRQICLTESWKGTIRCPKCGEKNNHVWPRQTTDTFWHETKR